MIIVFSKEFYQIDAVEKAVDAYQSLAVFDVKETVDKIKVEITEIDKDVKQVFKEEFGNYVLAETKKLK